MTREKFFTYFLLGITGFFILLLIYMLRSFIQPIVWAIIFSLVAYPVHIWMTDRMNKKTLSALFLTLVVFLLIVLPTFIIGFLLVQQAISITRFIVQYIQTHDYVNLVESLSKHPWAQMYIGKDTMDGILQYIKSESFRSQLFSLMSEALRKFGETTTGMILGIGNIVFKTSIFLLTFFFILRDGHKFFDFLKGIIPMTMEDIIEISGTIYKTVLAIVYGSIAVGIAQGVIGFIGYAIVGHKYALLLAFLTFLASFVPPFGSSFVWFPVAIYTLINIGTYQGIFLLLYGFLIISSIDNFIRPLFMKRDIELPYIVLFFSILGGLYTFGFLGLFLGPIVFTTTITTLYIYKKRILEKGSK